MKLKDVNKSAAATMRLTLTGDAMLKLLQTKQMSTREEARACMELMRSSNPELVRWVHDVTAEERSYTRIEVGCILNADSPSYPPEPDEYRQCAARGCKSCIAWVINYEKSAGGSATARPDAQNKVAYCVHGDFLEGSCPHCAQQKHKDNTDEDFSRPGEAPDFLITARGIAYAAHDGQMSRYGAKEPYIQHVWRVVALMSSESERAVAWLHDVLEDSPITTSDLEKLRIPGFIIDAVVLLTRPPTEHQYSWYIERIAKSHNALAMRAKLADLQDHLGHNSQFLSEAQRDRYRAAYATLGAAYEKLNRSFPSS